MLLTNFYFLATKEKEDHSWYSYKERYVLIVLSPLPHSLNTHTRLHTNARTCVSCEDFPLFSKCFSSPSTRPWHTHAHARALSMNTFTRYIRTLTTNIEILQDLYQTVK